MNSSPQSPWQLLPGGEAFFASLVEAINAAQAEVLLETYIFDFRGSVIAVAQALERAASRGVAVRLTVDGVGTGSLPSPWAERFARAGVQVQVFNPAQGWRVLLPRGWRRLHRKLCAVDAQIAFCGGINLLDDWAGDDEEALKSPRLDFAVRLTGAVATDIHLAMTRLWWHQAFARHMGQGHWVTGASVAQAGLRAEAGNPPESKQRSTEAPSPHVATLVLRDNVRFRRRIEGAYRRGLARARTEAIIACAYFIPGLQLRRSLIRAARRGVRVTLLLQGKYEDFFSYHAARAIYQSLLEEGVRIVEYDASYLHAKVAVMDTPGGMLATVGSSNLDPLSLLLAREANVFIRDDAFATELKSHLLAAMAQGHAVDVASHASRHVLLRGLDWCAYAAVRLLLRVIGQRY